jgi:hypothetical protein
VSVHAIAPVVAITSPTTGATVPGPSVNVAVTATPDPIGQAAVDYVEVCVVGGSCDYDETAPFAVTVHAASGARTLRATAYDVEGGHASVDVGVTVVDTPPSVHLDAPAPGDQVTTGAPFAVSATATSNPASGAAISFVTFEVLDAGGQLVDVAEDSVAPYASMLRVVDDGAYTVRATATDVNDLASAPSSAPVSAVTAAPPMRDGRFAILAG